MSDFDELRAKALAATPGPWMADIDVFSDENGYEACVSNVGTAILFTSGCDVPLHRPSHDWTANDSAIQHTRTEQAKASQPMVDAVYIAAASPDVVLILRTSRDFHRRRHRGSCSHRATTDA